MAMVEFGVTQMYCGITWKYDIVVMKKKGDWSVLCMEMLVLHAEGHFGYLRCMMSLSQ